METLVVAQHQNQYHSCNKTGISSQSRMPPLRGFKAISYWTSESSAGILPSPSSFGPSFDQCLEPKSPRFYSELPKPSKRSNPIAINPKPTTNGHNFNDDVDELSYSELWAGPAYSNSPPPSSLPIPKFSLRQKRSISLESPLPSSRIELPPSAKSAPPSPARDSFTFATENLRRILHLDIADD